MARQEILFFSPLSWDDLAKNGYRKTSGAMFKCFRERSDVSRIWYVQHDRRWGFSVGRQVVDGKVEVVGLPIGLPYERFSLIRKVNRYVQALLLGRTISEIKREAGLIYWFYDWLNIEVIRHLPQATTVMELTDSAEQFHATAPSMLRRLPGIKKEVRTRASFLFAVTAELAEEGTGGNCHTYVLSNGISEEFLSLADQATDEPEVLKGLAHPRLLVVGTQWSLNHRVDHKLLSDVMLLLDDWELVMVGCERLESEGLKSLAQGSRVHVFGMQSQAELIGLMQHVDVGAVPYVKGPQLRDTLKTYEYLACGKPVVLTADTVAPALEPYVRHAANANEFAEACRELLTGSPERQRATRAVLQSMTCERRAARALSFIRESVPQSY